MKANHDNLTTVLGLILGGLVAANVDWGLVLNGDRAQLGKIIAAVVLVLYGWSTNKSSAA